MGTAIGLSIFDGSTWTNLSEANGISLEGIEALCLSPDGNLWIGTWENGIFKYSNGNWLNFAESETMIEFVYTVGEDINGNIWIGGSHGISVFQDNTWEFIGSDDGLINTSVNTLVGDKSGNIWAGGSNGLSKITKLEY